MKSGPEIIGGIEATEHLAISYEEVFVEIVEFYFEVLKAELLFKKMISQV